MGRIYQGEGDSRIKLNTLQVCDKLRCEIDGKQAEVIGPHINQDIKNEKERFAHAVLDSYKFLPSETEHDMEVKKLCNHLMEKYQKSTAKMDGEDSVFQMLMDEILLRCCLKK